jgi:hypothetical protein
MRIHQTRQRRMDEYIEAVNQIFDDMWWWDADCATINGMTTARNFNAVFRIFNSCDSEDANIYFSITRDEETLLIQYEFNNGVEKEVTVHKNITHSCKIIYDAIQHWVLSTYWTENDML